MAHLLPYGTCNATSVKLYPATPFGGQVIAWQPRYPDGELRSQIVAASLEGIGQTLALDPVAKINFSHHDRQFPSGAQTCPTTSYLR